MDQALTPQPDQQPMVPGMGGTVFCPFGFNLKPCMKASCEMWVELNQGSKKVARCALAWNAIISTEVTQQLAILNRALIPSETIIKTPPGGKK